MLTLIIISDQLDHGHVTLAKVRSVCQRSRDHESIAIYCMMFVEHASWSRRNKYSERAMEASATFGGAVPVPAIDNVFTWCLITWLGSAKFVQSQRAIVDG